MAPPCVLGSKAGEHITYGDAMSPESLHGVHVEHAIAIVSMVSDPGATERMVRTVRKIMPKLPIVVRTCYRLEAERLLEMGATVAWRKSSKRRSRCSRNCWHGYTSRAT